MRKKLSILLIALMIIGYIFPVGDALANTPQQDANTYGRVIINNATSLENKDNASSIEATYTNGTLTVSGTGLYSNSSNNNEIYAKGNVTVNCTPNANYTCEIMNNGTNTHGSTLNLNDIAANQVINIEAEFKQSSQGNTAQSTITTSPGEGTYSISRPNPQTHQPEVVQENYDDMIDFRINGSLWDPSNPVIEYPYNPSEGTVVFTFETLWINRYYENIVINGTSYNVSDYINFDNRTSWLEHNNGTQMISFSITNVPKADSYNIVAKHGENNGTRFISTFLWTGDPAQASGHNYIGNAKLELVKAKYYVGDQTYTVTEDDIKENLVRDGDFMTFRSADGFMSYGVLADVNFDDGNLTLPGEAEVTMRVVPKYGYQVTSVNGGENFITTDEGVSEFTVVVHHGEAGYFQAEVTPVDNEVKSNSSKVSGGMVTIGNNEVDSGTVVLSVDDIELSADKIKDFKNAASGYEISTYLDINLNHVLYKGTEDDVWEDQIHHLDNEATVSLKLEKGINIEDVVIVHNVDDGDEFEIIKIDSWDPKTRILTFKTKSFSNYAIATKPASNTKVSNPKTGDNILIYVSLFAVSIVGFVGIKVYNKKKKIKC